MESRHYTHSIGKNFFTGPHPPSRKLGNRLHVSYPARAKPRPPVKMGRVAAGEAPAASSFVIETRKGMKNTDWVGQDGHFQSEKRTIKRGKEKSYVAQD